MSETQRPTQEETDRVLGALRLDAGATAATARARALLEAREFLIALSWLGGHSHERLVDEFRSRFEVPAHGIIEGWACNDCSEVWKFGRDEYCAAIDHGREMGHSFRSLDPGLTAKQRDESIRAEARADRDREWLAVLAKVHRSWQEAGVDAGTLAVEGVARGMDLREPFEALLPIPASASVKRGEDP